MKNLSKIYFFQKFSQKFFSFEISLKKRLFCKKIWINFEFCFSKKKFQNQTWLKYVRNACEILSYWKSLFNSHQQFISAKWIKKHTFVYISTFEMRLKTKIGRLKEWYKMIFPNKLKIPLCGHWLMQNAQFNSSILMSYWNSIIK